MSKVLLTVQLYAWGVEINENPVMLTYSEVITYLVFIVNSDYIKSYRNQLFGIIKVLLIVIVIIKYYI